VCAFIPINFRQIDVHKDQVGLATGSKFQPFEAGLSLNDSVAFCFQNTLDQKTIVRIIFDVENTFSGHISLRYLADSGVACLR
jgi:hypothetical protein